MSVPTYGYGVGPGGAATSGGMSFELGEVTLVDDLLVVELAQIGRVVDLPDDLEATLDVGTLDATLTGDLEVELADDDLGVELDCDG